MKEQPSSETARAALEKIRRESYREIKEVLIFWSILHQGKRTKGLIRKKNFI